MAHIIHLERLYPYPPELVWRALTEPDAIAHWMVATDFQPVVGQKFRFEAPSNGKKGDHFDGTVTLVDEPRQIAYTLSARTLPMPTTVTWTLTPQDGDTLLTLEHAGFDGLLAGLLGGIFEYAWQQLMLRLKQTMSELSRK